jgi:hypothetical protein
METEVKVKGKPALSWTGVLTALRDQGVAAILVEYAGSGDSGAIEHIGYLSEKYTDRNDLGVINPESYGAWDRIEDLHPEDAKKVNEFVEKQAYPILNTFDDWWNNDGGQGVFLIDTKDGSWVAQNGTNYTNVDYTEPTGKLEL